MSDIRPAEVTAPEKEQNPFEAVTITVTKNNMGIVLETTDNETGEVLNSIGNAFITDTGLVHWKIKEGQGIEQVIIVPKSGMINIWANVFNWINEKETLVGTLNTDMLGRTKLGPYKWEYSVICILKVVDDQNRPISRSHIIDPIIRVNK